MTIIKLSVMTYNNDEVEENLIDHKFDGEPKLTPETTLNQRT